MWIEAMHSCLFCGQTVNAFWLSLYLLRPFYSNSVLIPDYKVVNLLHISKLRKGFDLLYKQTCPSISLLEDVAVIRVHVRCVSLRCANGWSSTSISCAPCFPRHNTKVIFSLLCVFSSLHAHKYLIEFLLTAPAANSLLTHRSSPSSQTAGIKGGLCAFDARSRSHSRQANWHTTLREDIVWVNKHIILQLYTQLAVTIAWQCNVMYVPLVSAFSKASYSVNLKRLNNWCKHIAEIWTIGFSSKSVSML